MQLYSGFHQTIKDFLGLLTLFEKNSLGDFQDYVFVRNFITIQLVKKIFYKVIIINLITAEVNGDWAKSMPLFLPLGQLSYNLFHRNLSQLGNIAIAFRNRNKLIRRAILISNTHKGFKAYYFSGLTVHLGLIYHIEGILLNGILHNLQNLTDFFFFVSKLLTIKYQTVFSLPFRKAHGQSGVHDNRPGAFPAYGRGYSS